MSFWKLHSHQNCLKQWAWNWTQHGLKPFFKIWFVCIKDIYFFFLPSFNQYNTLEVVIEKIRPKHNESNFKKVGSILWGFNNIGTIHNSFKFWNLILSILMEIKSTIYIYKYFFFLSSFNQYNTLEVIIGIKPALSTMNPILRKWVQSCGVSITLEPFITALNFEILFYKF